MIHMHYLGFSTSPKKMSPQKMGPERMKTKRPYGVDYLIKNKK